MPVQAYQANGPVVMGVPQTGQATGPVVQGVPYRVDPANASPEKMPWLGQLPDKRQNAKLGEIRKGGELADRHPLFPETRSCNDCFWILPFLCVVAVAGGLCAMYVSGDIFKNAGVTHKDFPTISEIVMAGVAGVFASMVMAFIYVNMAYFAPGCVVWTSLIFGPCSMIVLGLVCFMFGGGFMLVGAVLVVIGILGLTCVFCCWMQYIPFMIVLTKFVADIIRQNPGLFLVSLLGSTLAFVWSLVVGLAILGAYLEHEDTHKDQHRGVQYAIYFVCVLVFIWGSLVAYNLAHVTYCGLFGRWYFKKDEGSQLMKSFTVATTTSFGSICLGSFLIAIIRALEATVSLMRRDAQEDGNIVCCVILCIIECLISCIGDIMDYFSEWAYVQVAVRGVNFCDSVRITFSFMSCANLVYVLKDLLLNAVVNFGSILCGVAGAVVGAGVGWSFGGDDNLKAIAGALVGFWGGVLAGGSAVGMFSSGVKTVLVLWAERPDELQQTHPEIHRQFEEKIMAQF